MPSMQKVASSNISEIGWEKESLYVRFTSNTLYKYAGVPESVYNSFQAAKSKGVFFAKEVKNVYACERIS